MARILVTGAGGFIGRALCPGLAARGHAVIAGLRRGPAPPLLAGVAARVMGDLTPDTAWDVALRDVDIVVHLAQRAHRSSTAGILADEAAIAAALIRGAGQAGVRRLVYLSSIKAMGDATPRDRPFRADDLPRPDDAYGRAKLASERTLREAGRPIGIELVVIRPPLVYGPGVGANFRALAWLAGSGLPLPFAALDNRRSLIFLANLVDLIALAVDHPAAAAQVLLASDGTDYSTPALIRLLAAGQGRTARLFRLPAAAYAAMRALPAVGPAIARLTLSLQVDDTATRAALDWTPPIGADTGLVLTARALAAR